MNADVEAMLEAPFEETKNNGQEAAPDNDHPMTEKHESSRHSSRSSRTSRSPSRHRSSSRSHRSQRSHSRHSRHYRSRSRDRDRERDRDRDRDRERDRDRDRERRRRHDRSRSPRRDERRSRYDSRERRPRSRSPGPNRSIERFGPRRRGRARSVSPPVSTPDSDRRTVFVSQLARHLTERDLEKFFAEAGKVYKVNIITNRRKRPLGMGYVEFEREESVTNALSMSGQKLLGIPILVNLSEAEKNRAAMEEQQKRVAATNPRMLYQHRLFIGSIDTSLSEDDVRKIFEQFGRVDNVDLRKGDGNVKLLSDAYIQYSHPSDAKKAQETMNGFELCGRQLQVEYVTEENSALMNHINLDEEDSRELTLNAIDRAELMKKLAYRHTDGPKGQENGQREQAPMPAPPVLIVPEQATRILQLSNMFNPEEETEPGWAKDLEIDVKEECEKFGSVENLHLKEDSMGVIVLKYYEIQGAEKAKKDLDGRWFGGRQVRAHYMSEAMYRAEYSM